MRCKTAFTLIELLVVISIVALLTGILLPALGKVRASARNAQCLSNARQMTMALSAYTQEYDGSYVTYRYTANGGYYYWFGFEPFNTLPDNRPLDKSRSPLARFFGGDIQQGLECPDFPRSDPGFFPKFAVSSAHYGYNGGIAWPFDLASPFAKPPRRVDEVKQPSSVFAFADAIHQDFFPTRFQEPHEVAFRKSGFITGAGHFRHGGRANAAMLDGHVVAMQPVGQVFVTLASSAVANLDVKDGPGSIYGFDTWSDP